MTWGIVVAFLAAVLSGLGVGSAGLFVLWLTFVEKLPQFAAQGTNLVFFLFSAGSALCVHTLQTRLLWRALPLLITFGLLGCLLGVRLAAFLPQALLRRLFGAFLIITGALGLFRKGQR